MSENKQEQKSNKEKRSVPLGVWNKCDNCHEILYAKELNQNKKVCAICGYHFKFDAWDRINLLIDHETFIEYDHEMTSADPIKFEDLKMYKDRIKSAMAKSGRKDAVITGEGKLSGLKLGLGVMDFSFLGGSMGSVVGEKLTRLIENSIKEKMPVIIVSTSGGARMQESMCSLMQMAKVSATLAKLSEARLPFISVLADPTTGGVSASFAMLGDINMAEPNALIAFAGPRVIEQTIRQKLPEGFQRTEFLKEHGMIDMIVERENMKHTLSRTLKILLNLNYSDGKGVKNAKN
ncbi:MAG: acetyl-CoA carboxylase carboxyltransferase subunit beta [bacterium]|nr:acetyl-CoA carboxylase carboxyltransferase subunit beta [bacterium]